MRISAKADYALRAAVELATQPREVPVKADQIAVAQDIPIRFLENILAELRAHDIVESSRGADGGYWLSPAPADLTVAEIIRAVEGPVASVHGERPDRLAYRGAAKPLQDVFLALRANVRAVLESVTLADVASGELPAGVRDLSSHPQATADAPSEL